MVSHQGSAVAIFVGILTLSAHLLPAQGRDTAARADAGVSGSRGIARVAGATALAGIAFLVDQPVRRSMQSESVQSSSFLRNSSDIAGAFADPGVIVFSAATYIGGLGTHCRQVATLGMYTGEAVVLGGVVAEALKGIAGRSRPKTDSLGVHSFHFGKGFGNDSIASFPSAETTIAFAAAAAGSRYSARVWPGAAHIVTPVAYSIAAAAGLSRLYKNEHWASDVSAGALLGSLSGIGFDRWNQRHPNNIWERIFLPRTVSVSASTRSARWAFTTR